MGTRGRLAVAGLLALAVVATLIGVALHRRDWGAAENGTGLMYEGRFYWASGQEVAPEALGPVLEADVAFQDTRADLRSIDGFEPRTALAALLPSLDGSPGGVRWTFLSTDIDRGTNPRGYADSRAVLVPSRS